RRVVKKKVETKGQLSITFGKRCKDLFIEASELSLLYDVKLVILVEPINKKKRKRKELYSLEHPSFDAVYEGFLNGVVPPDVDVKMKNIMMPLYEECKLMERKMGT
ncbi:hypothetical protein CFOL_v3_16086, partial [Cephalotus follicularis]